MPTHSSFPRTAVQTIGNFLLISDCCKGSCTAAISENIICDLMQHMLIHCDNCVKAADAPHAAETSQPFIFSKDVTKGDSLIICRQNITPAVCYQMGYEPVQLLFPLSSVVELYLVSETVSLCSVSPLFLMFCRLHHSDLAFLIDRWILFSSR